MRVRVVAGAKPGYHDYMKLIKRDDQAAWHVQTLSGATGWIDASITAEELVQIRDQLAASVAADEARLRPAVVPPPQ
jgi:hypothetical protein